LSGVFSSCRLFVGVVAGSLFGVVCWCTFRFSFKKSYEYLSRREETGNPRKSHEDVLFEVVRELQVKVRKEGSSMVLRLARLLDLITRFDPLEWCEVWCLVGGLLRPRKGKHTFCLKSMSFIFTLEEWHLFVLFLDGVRLKDASPLWFKEKVVQKG